MTWQLYDYGQVDDRGQAKFLGEFTAPNIDAALSYVRWNYKDTIQPYLISDMWSGLVRTN